jgi:hypothetical protein
MFGQRFASKSENRTLNRKNDLLALIFSFMLSDVRLSCAEIDVEADMLQTVNDAAL